MDEQTHSRTAGLNRRTLLRLLGLGGGAALLAACQSPAPAAQPTAAPAKPAAAPTTAPAKPAAAAQPTAASAAPKPAAAATTAPAVKADATKAWDDLVAAAKQEGTLTVYGPPGGTFRTIHVENFQKAYPDIKLDYQGANGSQQAPKLVAERQAGKFIADLYIGGATSPIGALLPIDALDPVEPALVHPEVTNKANWFKNEYMFMDKAQKYIFTFIGNAGATALLVNTQGVDKSQLKTWRDLLDPKWKGKIASGDPSVSGTAVGALADIAAVPQYGADFVRKLYSKETGIVVTADDRQLTDWVAQGVYPIAIGVRDIEQVMQLGLPIEEVPLDVVTLSPAFGNVTLMNKAPHPNAAKLYLNWMLMKGPQQEYQKLRNDASLRMDIGREGVKPGDVPDPSKTYVNTQKEEFSPLRGEMRKIVKEAQAA